MRYSVPLQFMIALVFVVSSSVSARAQVDCSNPDNLCTGDPCVIGSIEVGQPCNVDFTPRALVIAGTLTVPSGGAVSFTADSISVPGRVVSTPPLGCILTLVATDDIVVDGRVRLQGISEIALTAGTDIALGGAITLFSSDSGEAVLDVQAGEAVATTGRVTAHGARVTLSGPQGVQVEGVMNVGRINGNTLGGLLEISSYSGGVVLSGVVRLPSRGTSGTLDGGELEVNALDDIVVNGRILGRGREDGAAVQLTSSAGDVTINAPIVATPTGTVVVEAAGQATINSSVSVGGEGRFPGCCGAGFVRVEAGSIVVDARATLRNDAPVSGGRLCFNATGGDLQLSGTFLARATDPEMGAPPGIIEASSAGNLVADGSFRCAPNGCIGLMAAGVLDTTEGSFDKTPSPDCGYCP
jgi:hypothetical protein